MILIGQYSLMQLNDKSLFAIEIDKQVFRLENQFFEIF